MNITRRAGAALKSSSETRAPSVSGSEKSGAGVPSGSMLDGVRTIGHLRPVPAGSGHEASQVVDPESPVVAGDPRPDLLVHRQSLGAQDLGEGSCLGCQMVLLAGGDHHP